MAVVFNPFSGGGRRNPFSLDGGAKPPSPDQAELSKERAELQKGLATTRARLASSPEVLRQNRLNPFSAQAQAIAEGQGGGGGGILGSLLAPAGRALGSAATVLGTVGRGVVSTAKELSDIASADDVSFSDWWRQTNDPKFGVKSVMREYGVTTGLGWLDSGLAFALDVAVDPTTYIGLGTLKYSGRAGRLNLATRAMEASNIAKAPSLAAKFDDIARRGEWALDDFEREVLNVPKGFRYGMTENAPIIRGTGRAAESVGKNFAAVRAWAGDIPASQWLMNKLQPQSYGELLKDVGRGKLTQDQALKQLAHWSASKAGRGAGRVIVTQLADRNAELIKEISESPFRATVLQAVENPDLVVDPAERALADKITSFYADALNVGNEKIAELAAKRGLSGALGINQLDNYSMHSITDDAKKWLRRKGENPDQEFVNILSKGDLNIDDLVNGASVARMRRVTAGEDWLGRTLERGTVEEINRVSEEVLGFKWFKDDAVDVLQDYMFSIASTARRTAYIDRLFDFGPEVIKPLLKKVVPDKELVAGLNKVVGEFAAIRRILRGSVKEGTKQVEAALTAQARRSGKAVQAGVRTATQATAKNADALARLDSAQATLAELSAVVDRMIGKDRASAEAMLDGFRKSADALRSQIERGEAERALGLQELQKAYLQVFPSAKRIPKDPKVIEAKILAAKGRLEEQIAVRVAERDKIQSRLGTLRRKLDQMQYNEVVREVERLDREITQMSIIAQAADNAPYSDNGLVYVSVGELQRADGFGFAVDTNADEIVEAGADPSQVVAALAPPSERLLDVSDTERLLETHYAVRDALTDFIDDALGGTGMVSSGFKSGGFSDEFSNLMDEAYEAAQEGRLVEIDPLFAQTQPELSEIINKYNLYYQWAFSKMDEDFLPEELPIFLFRSIGDGLDSFAYANNLDPEMGQAAIRYILGTGSERNQFIGSLVPAKVFDDNAESGIDVLFLPATSPIFKQDPTFGGWWGNNEYGTSLLENSPTYKDMTYSGQFDIEESIATTQAEKGWYDETIREGEQTVATRDALAEVRDALTGEVKAKRQELRPVSRSAYGAEKGLAQMGEIAYETEKVGKKVRRVRLSREQAQAQIDELDKSAEKAEQKLRRMVGQAEATTVTGASGTQGTVAGARTELSRAQRALDKTTALVADSEDWTTRVKPVYDRDIGLVVRAIETSPLRGPAQETASAWALRARRVLEQVDEAVRMGAPEAEALDRVVRQLLADEADLAILETVNIPRAQMELTAARAGTLGGKIVDDVEKGWTALQGMGVQIPNDIRQIAIDSVRKLRDPQEFNKFWDAYLAYNRFFKIYATLTPGFSIRNAMSATFMNYVMGVTTDNIKLGVKAAYAYMRTGPDKWLNTLTLSAADRQLYENAWRVTAASSAGQTVNDIMEPVLQGKGGRILNNKVTRASAKFNEGVEFSVRFAMALDSLKNGASFDDALQRVSRTHFDYTDLSKVDAYARQVIPFWIWTSRNVPLQISTMWVRPSVYSKYENLRKNFPTDDDLLMPEWLASKQPIGLGGNVVLSPDLPQIDMERQIASISDPKRLLGNLNPLIKLPFEMYGSNQLQTDIPFGSKPVVAEGSDLLTALIGLPFGQTTQSATGDVLITPKLQYAVGNILPPLARLQRLVPETGGKPSYADRRLSSWLTTMGVPVREVTLQEQTNEAIARQRALEDFIVKLRNQGWVPPTR